jgi:hypothetical protein
VHDAALVHVDAGEALIEGEVDQEWPGQVQPSYLCPLFEYD